MAKPGLQTGCGGDECNSSHKYCQFWALSLLVLELSRSPTPDMQYTSPVQHPHLCFTCRLFCCQHRGPNISSFGGRRKARLSPCFLFHLLRFAQQKSVCHCLEETEPSKNHSEMRVCNSQHSPDTTTDQLNPPSTLITLI